MGDCEHGLASFFHDAPALLAHGNTAVAAARAMALDFSWGGFTVVLQR